MKNTIKIPCEILFECSRRGLRCLPIYHPRGSGCVLCPSCFSQPSRRFVTAARLRYASDCPVGQASGDSAFCHVLRFISALQHLHCYPTLPASRVVSARYICWFVTSREPRALHCLHPPIVSAAAVLVHAEHITIFRRLLRLPPRSLPSRGGDDSSATFLLRLCGVSAEEDGLAFAREQLIKQSAGLYCDAELLFWEERPGDGGGVSTGVSSSGQQVTEGSLALL